MFTVKLYKGHAIKLVSAKEVNIFSSLKGNNDEPIGVAEISIQSGMADGPDQQAFFIADTRNRPRPAKFADTVEFYDSAYIENQHGATTQIVRPPAV